MPHQTDASIDLNERRGALSPNGARRMLQQAFELWINPELMRRRDAGLLPEGFQLFMAQRIQRPDGTVAVRLNDEVRGVAMVKATRDVALGDDMLINDLDGIESFDLIDEELDYGHWTVFFTGKRWIATFNFLSQRSKCLDLLDKARQFLESAQQAQLKVHPAVAVDNLFSACELISKAELVSSQVMSLDSKSHGQIASQLNRWRKLGNIENAFVDLFNKLSNLRGPYRYDAGYTEAMPISDEDLELVTGMIEKGVAKVGAKIDKSPDANAIVERHEA